uniref:Uncharacterized protein n=2 Tax=Geoglobus ahangari TaxID=113653 RepID=A0A7C3YFR7_9EURY
MSERDLIIERLESKLAEKEKEIRELRKVASMSVDEIKEAVLSEIKAELDRIKAKVIELNKTVESLMDEVLFIKSEVIKKEKPREIREIGTEEDKEDKKKEEVSYGKLIICD